MPDPQYQRCGQYIILDRINVGGMAEVFRGRQSGAEGFKKLVAIKRILPAIAADEDFIEMFIDEAKLAVQMQHANVVQIYDLGQAEDVHYIAMEYVSGVDLRTIWDRARKRNRLLPIAMSSYIMQRVCEGLDYAHRKKDEMGKEIGLVHRDVSPQNILISFEGEVKVVDFGIAKAKQKVGKTQAGILKGKFGYMSPEQVRGMELDNRSDIFATGIVIWEMLVGDRLFLGETDFSTLEKVRNVEMVPPTHFNKNLSPQIERIVMKALAKSRDDRYRHASELAEDLQRFLFSSNQPFSRTDLQRYMKQHFEREIEEEYARLERYSKIRDEDFGEPPSAKALSGSAGFGQESSSERMTAHGPLDGQDHGHGGGRVPTALQPNPLDVRGPISQPPPARESFAFQDERRRSLPGPPPPPAGLPTWAKVTIGSLAGLVLLALGLTVFLLTKVGLVSSEPGSLTIDVTPPDAEILFGEELVSTQSPYTRSDLPPGTYSIQVRKKGFKRVVHPVRIEAGEPQMLPIKLEPDTNTASVLVRSKPKGLPITIDNKPTEKVTPATITGLLPGKHTLVLELEGEVIYEAPLELEPGAAEAIEVDVERLPPVLEVSSNIEGAQVLINGKQIGLTPIKTTLLPPKTVRLQVRMRNCETYEQDVELKPAIRKRLAVQLQCKS